MPRPKLAIFITKNSNFYFIRDKCLWSKISLFFRNFKCDSQRLIAWLRKLLWHTWIGKILILKIFRKNSLFSWLSYVNFHSWLNIDIFYFANDFWTSARRFKTTKSEFSKNILLNPENNGSDILFHNFCCPGLSGP